MTTPTRAPRPFKTDTRVQWIDGMRPTAHPHTSGIVFLSNARQTFVIWDGTMSPVAVFTGALTREGK